MGEIIYQGPSPFRLIPAQPSSARAVRNVVVVTVYASVHGKPSHACPVQIPMAIGDMGQNRRECVSADSQYTETNLALGRKHEQFTGHVHKGAQIEAMGHNQPFSPFALGGPMH